MGFIEEGRQLIQDFVAPEIRALEVRIDAVEKKIDALDARMEKRFDATDGKIERSHNQVMDALHRMETFNQILDRLARLESKLKDVA